MIALLNIPWSPEIDPLIVRRVAERYGLAGVQQEHIGAGNTQTFAYVESCLPGNLLLCASATGRDIADLRRALGAKDSYIYCYRPERGALQVPISSPVAERQHLLNQLEIQSALTDVGFPLPAADIESLILNIFSDICDTGDLVEPQPDFAQSFAVISRSVRHLFPEAAVEHIGSSALGIKTKPIIDILLSVPPKTLFAECVAPLHSLGFYWVDYPGNDNRWYFRYGFPRKQHIHLVRKGSKEERIHLLFRDRLVENVHLREEYETLKVRLSHELTQDRAQYGREKSLFIQRVIADLL